MPRSLRRKSQRSTNRAGRERVGPDIGTQRYVAVISAAYRGNVAFSVLAAKVFSPRIDLRRRKGGESSKGMIALASGVFNVARSCCEQRSSRPAALEDVAAHSLQQRKGILSRVAKSNSVVTRLTAWAAEKEMHYREKIADRVIISILQRAIAPRGGGGWATSGRTQMAGGGRGEGKNEG